MLTREELTAIYEREIENQPKAGVDVRSASQQVNEALDAYCAAIHYEVFCWAYELGLNAGKKVLS